MSALTPLALQNAAILRAFRGTGRGGGQVIHNRHELADALKRDRSNLRKSIQTLAEAGLLIIEDHDSTLYVCRLTDDGEAAMAAMDRADGIDTSADAIPEGFIALRHDQVGPDPDNARKKSGLSAEAIAEMAESLLDKGILQQPGVRQNPDHDPADVASPSYLLTMGERRWRAWGLLIERGDWLASKTILCKLSDFDDAERLEAGLIENDQRADINNLERGEQYLVLHERHGRTPQQLAKKVNRTPRFVQIAMKVAKSADAEDKARFVESERAYAEGKARNIPGAKRMFTWEALRDTVKTARYQTALEKRSRITLLVAELAMKVEADPDALQVGDDASPQLVSLISTPPGGGHWGEAQDLGVVVDHREDGRIYGGVTADAREWLKDAGFDKDPRAYVRALANEALGSTMPYTLAEEAGVLVTVYLNPPKPTPAPAPVPPANPDEATDDTITPYQALLLGEVLHKTRHHGQHLPSYGGNVAMLTPGAQLAQDNEAVRQLLYGGYLGAGDYLALGRQYLRITDAGVDYLDKVDLNPIKDIRKLHALRTAAHGMRPLDGHLYAISWLNEPPTEANAVRDAAPASEPASPPLRDSFADQIRQVNAEDQAPAATSPTPQPARLEPDEFVVLAEVAHKITTQGVEARGGAIKGAMTYGHHIGPHTKLAQALLHKRYLMFVQAPNSHGFMASLTQLAWDEFGGPVDDETLDGFRHDNWTTDELLTFEASGQRYATTWLQDPVKVVEPKVAAPADQLPSGAGDDYVALPDEPDLGSPFAEDQDDDAADPTSEGVGGQELAAKGVAQIIRETSNYLMIAAIGDTPQKIHFPVASKLSARDLATALIASGSFSKISLYSEQFGHLETWSAE